MPGTECFTGINSTLMTLDDLRTITIIFIL